MKQESVTMSPLTVVALLVVLLLLVYLVPLVCLYGVRPSPDIERVSELVRVTFPPSARLITSRLEKPFSGCIVDATVRIDSGDAPRFVRALRSLSLRDDVLVRFGESDESRPDAFAAGVSAPDKLLDREIHISSSQWAMTIWMSKEGRGSIVVKLHYFDL